MDITKKKILYFLVSISICILGGYYFIITDTPVKGDEERIIHHSYHIQKDEEPHIDGTVLVYITGAVENPGLYEMTTPATWKDVIEASKGLLPYADANHINLAQTIEKSQHIHIDFQFNGDREELLRKQNISINDGTEQELQSISGIGPKMAKKIVAYRAEHGPFTRIEDLRQVKGIGPALYKKIESQVRL